MNGAYLSRIAKNPQHLNWIQLGRVCLEKVKEHCENILSGYLCVVTTVFSQQDGFSIFKFPESLWRSLLEISLL
jgi:hypothetical protein